jgi:hypothetical protein
MSALEDRIEEIAVASLRKATEYKGFGLVPAQVTAFQADPVWSHFGMGTESFLKLRYIGNYYTAIFRKIGDMYEGFVRAILAHTLGLSEPQLSLSFTIVIEGRRQIRTLDARIDTADLRPSDAVNAASVIHDIEPAYTGGLVGFEVRCCYQIGDSKRIQADENAATYLRGHGFLPVLMIFCTTSLTSPVNRLRRTWVVTEGMASYELLKRLSGFDLYAHLERLRPKLAEEMRHVLRVFQLPEL